MEIIASLSSITTSLACILLLGLIWNAVDWVWLRPKRLEKKLRELGFEGNSYRFLFGDKKQNVEMGRENSAKPMDHFSNNYVPHIFPFFHQTIFKYGEKSFVWDGPRPTVLMTKPELIREVLMRMKDFPREDPHPLLKKLTNGLIRLEGQKWARDRKLINTAFHMEKLKHMLPTFYTSALEMIDEWEKMVSKTGSDEVEVWSFIHNMAADAVSRAAFGRNFEEGKRVIELIREQLTITISDMRSVYIPGWRFLPTPTNRRVEKISREVEALLKDMIYKRKKTMEAGEAAKDDLLGVLVKSSFQGIRGYNQHQNYKKQEQNIKLSLKEVIEECKLFHFVGQDTTSSMLVWTLILLSKHQHWQEQAREEILMTFGTNRPDYEGLNQLKKMNMVLYEVLRLYPSVEEISREVRHDTMLGEMQLPAGVIIGFPFIHVHQNEKIWGPDAKEFRPERFSKGMSTATGGNMSFFSFGWGPHSCVGSNFAMIEAKVTLALILQRFSLELSPSYAHAPTVKNGTLRPQFGAKIIIRRI